ncbi:MAG: SelB C-terminal domain-containing protein, partial [Stellaceae bacterium]
SGAVTVGDRVMVSPRGLIARVRSIHAQNRPAMGGLAGQRCALNLAGDGITKEVVSRGDTVLDPALHAPTARIDARLRLLGSETEPITTWHPVRFHHHAAALGARVVPLGAATIAPGTEGWAQFVLERPIAAAFGDRFILRDTSAQRTIGGGFIVDLHAAARRRRTPLRQAQLAASAKTDPADALGRLLVLLPHYIDLTAFLRDRAFGPDEGSALTARLGLVRLAVDDRVFALSPDGWAMISDAVVKALAGFHAAYPDVPGMPPDRLRREIAPRSPASLFQGMVAELTRQRVVVVEGGLIRRPEHEARLTTAQRALWSRIEPLIGEEARFQPPRLAELAARLAIAESELRRFLKTATQLGFVEEVAPDHFFRRDAIAEIVALLPALTRAAADGQFGAAALRDRLGGGRKAAIEILEFLDRRGVTVRRGDLRRLAQRSPATADRSG